MAFSRRRFIRNTSFGLLSTAIPFQSYSTVLTSFLSSLTLDERLKIAADKRKDGLTDQAIDSFTQIVTDYPGEIRAYDGLRKSLLQQQFKELEVLQLYVTGYANNPNNKDFKERLAKEYMRMILGNKKFTNQYNSSQNLLVEAKTFFNQLKNDYPNRPEYEQLFKKAKRKLNHQADVIDARENIDEKDYKKAQRKKFKKRFNDKTDLEVESKLNFLLSKPQTEFRKKHIKELYRILIKRYKKNQNWQQAYVFALDLYNYDKTDSISLRKAKRFSIKTNNFQELVNICQENHIVQNTFWSKLGLFDAQFKRYNKTGFGSLSVMDQLLYELENEGGHLPDRKVEIYVRAIRLSYKQQNLIAAYQNLLDLGQLLSRSQNPHLAVRYSVLAARYFSKTQDYSKGIQTIKLALGEKVQNDTSNELLNLAQEVNQEVTGLKEVHRQRLIKVLERLYNNQNP